MYAIICRKKKNFVCAEIKMNIHPLRHQTTVVDFYRPTNFFQLLY